MVLSLSWIKLYYIMRRRKLWKMWTTFKCIWCCYKSSKFSSSLLKILFLMIINWVLKSSSYSYSFLVITVASYLHYLIKPKYLKIMKYHEICHTLTFKGLNLAPGAPTNFFRWKFDIFRVFTETPNIIDLFMHWILLFEEHSLTYRSIQGKHSVCHSS